MVKSASRRATSTIDKTVSCPPELLAGHLSRWGLAKLHAKARFVNAAERLSSRRGSYRHGASTPMESADGKPIALVGPVIGLVTSTSARILLEVDRQATVEMTLHKEDEEDVFQISQQLLRLSSAPIRLHKFKRASPAQSARVNSEHTGSAESSVHSHGDGSTHSQERLTPSKQHRSNKSRNSSMQRASSSVLRLWSGRQQRDSPSRRKNAENGEAEIDTVNSTHSVASSSIARSTERSQPDDRTIPLDSSDITMGTEGSQAEEEVDSFGSVAIASRPRETRQAENGTASSGSSPIFGSAQRSQVKGTTTFKDSLRRRGSRSFAKLWRGSSSTSSRVGKNQRAHHLSHGVAKEEKVIPIVEAMKSRRPCAFVFKGLEPKTRYRVEVKGCHNVEKSSFRTFPSKLSQRFCMASISCNSIFITKQTITGIDDLWSHLQKSIESNHIDLLIHLGDQIYGDGDRHLDVGAGKNRDRWSNRFEIGLHMLKDLPQQEWALKQEEICEKYREVYRETWRHPSTAKCLAHCPSLMIYDDHEIRDNWGDNCRDHLRDSMEYFVAQCAWTVTLEYQRQLFEDVDFTNINGIEKDYYFHAIDKIGMMFLDIRGSRTFHRVENDKTPYLGSRQWEDIDQALGDGGMFQSVQVLVVCSPAPLVFLVPSVTVVAHKTIDRLEDFKGHWSTYKHEQKRMIHSLKCWKVSRAGREVIVLGGDVHCGGHSSIMESGETLFYQLTTSPIANMPLPKTAYYAMRVAEQFENIQGFRFHHFNWTRARNYGLVHVNFREEAEEVPEVVTQLVRGKFLRPVQMGRRVSNFETYACMTCISRSSIRWCKSKMFNVAVRACETNVLAGSTSSRGLLEKDANC